MLLTVMTKTGLTLLLNHKFFVVQANLKSGGPKKWQKFLKLLKMMAAQLARKDEVVARQGGGGGYISNLPTYTIGGGSSV